MIDPYNLNPPIKGLWNRQEWVLFAIAVAGRNAKMVANKVNRLFEEFRNCGQSPFVIVHNLQVFGCLRKALRRVKMGQYDRIAKAWAEVSKLRMAQLSVPRLEATPGIGPKIARMIMMYLQPGLRVAPLDTHVLKFLRYQGHKAPKTTPLAGNTYARLENAFLNIADAYNLTPTQLDTAIWQHLASGQPIETLYFERLPNAVGKR